MNRLMGVQCAANGTLLRWILRSIRPAVMQQFVEIVSDYLFPPVARHLQEGIIAERYIPSCVQTAEAIDDGIQDQP
jgi:hypothetical protein